MNDVTLKDFVRDFYGARLSGLQIIWSLKTKRTKRFGPGEVDDLVMYVDAHKETEDLYIGLCTQPAGTDESVRGTSETVVELPGFFIDVDFALDKQSTKRYPPDETTALELINSFELKPYFVQRSGNGLHALYALDSSFYMRNRELRRKAQALSKAFARRLAAHLAAAGYEIDSVSDLARVFRVPGTFNHKGSERKPVTTIIYSPEARYTWADFEQAGSAVPAKTAPSEPRRLAQHSAIRRECAWYEGITGDDAGLVDEPNWHAGASITARCGNGSDIFHKYSQKHRDYDEPEARVKFERAASEAGPRTCAAIRELGNQAKCDVCRHRGHITSPIQLGFPYDPGATGPLPLGYTNQGDFVIIDQERKILVTASSNQLLSGQFLVGLAPSQYWTERFPRQKGGFNSYSAGEALIAAAKSAGPFVAGKVRGRGVWTEGERVILNFGDPVESAAHLYLCFQRLQIDLHATFDVDRLFKLISLLPWREPEDAILVLGWVALAPICGVLNWRPHLFVYGPPNSGKTTLHRLISSILKPLVVSADGQSTEAGLRQMLGPDSLPIAIDEFETDQREGRLQSIVRLARSASSAETTVYRGTPEGKALQFSLRTMFFLSAINVIGMSAADASRIITAELKAHGSDVETGRTIAGETSYFAGLGPRWSGYMAAQARHIQSAIEVFRAEVRAKDSRHELNMATLLAGAFVALSSRPPTAVEAAEWVARYSLAIRSHGQAHERDDAMEALNYLLSHNVRGHDQELPLAHFLALERAAQSTGLQANRIAEYTEIVARFGIRIDATGDSAAWYIRNGSPAIDKVYEGTPWARGAWRKALGQIPRTFSPPNPINFPMMGKHRALGLPLDLIPEPLGPLPTSGKERF